MWTGKTKVICAARTKTDKFGQARGLRGGTPDSDCGSEKSVSVIFSLSWERGTKVIQLRGSKGLSMEESRGKVKRKELAWPVSGTLSRMDGEMARGERRKEQVEDCM